jgi:hypothetical protein
VYHAAVSALVPKYGGYIAERADGLCLVAFSRAESAIAWALACQGALLDAPWPEQLLKHELCEPMSATVVIQASEVGAGFPHARLPGSTPGPAEAYLAAVLWGLCVDAWFLEARQCGWSCLSLPLQGPHFNYPLLTAHFCTHIPWIVHICVCMHAVSRL